MFFRSAVAFVFAALALATPSWAGNIMVMDSYARSATANAPTGAAFLVIGNHGEEDDRLTGVTSPAAKRVELHTHEEDADGVMKMRHVVEGFTLPAGGEIVMQRGGQHVMFMGLTEPFEQGAMIPLTLEFEKAGTIEVEVPVDLERKAGHGQSHGSSE